MRKRKSRVISLLLAIVTMFTATFASTITTYAADYKGKLYVIDLPRGNETNRSGWGHPAMSFMGGWKSAASEKTTIYSIDSYTSATSYCIEPGVGIHTGDSVTQKGEDFWRNYPADYNQTISPLVIKLLIGRILQYGWTGNNSVNWVSTDPTSADHIGEILATQLLIWETVVGERTADFGKVNANAYGANNILDLISGSHPCRSQIMSHYYDIENKVKRHTLRPSFCSESSSGAPTLELKYDGSKYTVSIEDTNGVLSNYNFSTSTPGVSLSKSGNTLTISTSSPPSGTFSIRADKIESKTRALITWTDGVVGPGHGQVQDTITYGETVSDPVQAFTNVKVSAGNCNIIKKAEDGYKAGFEFNIKGNGIDKNVTTGADGTVFLSNIPAGIYTVTEINLADRYVQPGSQSVTIQAGQTATVNFENKLKRGNAEFRKCDIETGQDIEAYNGWFIVLQWNKNTGQYEENGVMGYDKERKVYTTSLTWENNMSKPSCLVVTAENEGKFKIKEKGAPFGYICPIDLSYEIVIKEDGEVHQLGVDGVVVNQPKKSKIEIIKTDDETNKPLSDVVFTVKAFEDVVLNGEVKYKKGEVVDVITTNNEGIATTRELYLGNYEVWETKAHDGYSSEPYFSYNGYFEQGTPCNMVITTEDFSDTEPIYIARREYTNKPQKGQFVIQKQGEVLTGFDFMATEFGIKNTPIYEVQDIDEVGITYEIYAAEDIVVNGDVKHKKGELVDTVETKKCGEYWGDPWISAAESEWLYLGKYRIVETIAPEGFFIGSTEYEVELTYKGQEWVVYEENLTIYNERQHMKVGLTKTIEENQYYPNPNANQDIIFGIYTAEDITDKNGNVLLEKDSLVDCFGVDQAGQGFSVTDLPFGKYYAKELQTAEGYILDKGIYPFEFTPLEQTIPLIWVDLNENDTVIENKTIKGRVHIEKTSSFDGRSLPGAVYGIFRASDDELLMTLETETNEFDGSAGATSELIPYGKYYLKEITPANHYHLDPTEYLFFIGKRGEETITLNFDLMDEPIIGALAPFYNEKGLKEYLDGSLMPQTGDNSYLNLALGGAAISGFVVLTLVIKRSKKRRKRTKN